MVETERTNVSRAVWDRSSTLYAERGAAEYHGEAVTQLEHALQTALLAEQAGATPPLIVAALLHDVGHLLGDGDDHEALGYRYLAKYFGPDVCDPVRLHVAAKRYLCTKDEGYRAVLSPESQRTFLVQGGAMTDDEVREFESNPHFADALALRRWDDAAKVPGLATPTFLHYLTLILVCTRPA
jgi:phosphonate degradation associated HDIG domain protein